jgi:hypothetical protein
MRTCPQTKKRLSSALEKAREVFQAKKRRKMEDTIQREASETSNHPVIDESPLTKVLLPSHQQVRFLLQPTGVSYAVHQIPETTCAESQDLDQPLAERRVQRQNRQLPKRYRDIAPEPPTALLPASLQVVSDCPWVDPKVIPAQPSPVRISPVKRLLKSARNIFGLFRQYCAARFPDHDPDENIAPNDLIDTSLDSSCIPPRHDYYPYSNLSSFLLGEWYWNDGEKKSQSSFQNLVKIIGHPEFHPEDIAGKNWRAIDAHLSGEHCKGLNEDDWEDVEDDGVGHWIKTPIKINIPFHKRMLNPGTKEFNTGILHHRKLTSVIREKLTRPSTHPHLHFEPYSLFWQPSEAAEPVRVYGELFTSDAFIEAHHELQESPGEPGCELPRVVIGLMFASDGTQLTSFSTAKLWPVYLMIGNESKDRRSKPSCHAFEHVAYLETVCDGFMQMIIWN